MEKGQLPVVLIFLLSCLAIAAFILRRPYLRVRLRRRRLRVETYFIGALLGPLLLLGLGFLPFPEILESLSGDGRIQPAGILALFFSMVFISVFLDITGVFEYCARRALNWAGGDGRKLFFSLYATVSVLTIFTSNDIIILTFTPLICYFARHARVDPVPYLLAEFFAANTWSMLLYVGNPTNIILAGAFGLEFVEYARWMLLPTLLAGAVNLLGLYLLFRKEISRPLERTRRYDAAKAVTDRPGALLGLVLLMLVILGLALAPKLGLQMWPIALAAAGGLLAILIGRRSWARLLGRDLKKSGGPGLRRTLGRLPWAIVPFALSMFVTVGALNRSGITRTLGEALASGCGDSPAVAVAVCGAGSAFAANLLNNIPMTLAFAALISSLRGTVLFAAALAVAAGSNLGANLTPLGALAGIMWMSILKQKGVRMSFGRFVKTGLLITPASLLAALGILALQTLF